VHRLTPFIRIIILTIISEATASYSIIESHRQVRQLNSLGTSATIPIRKTDQKYLKFRWRGKLFQCTCVPFGLSIAPWLFTKIMKPVLKYLRSKMMVNVSYLDDCLIIGQTFIETEKSTDEIVRLYKRLGLLVNFDKSVLLPTTLVKFLGFIIDSVEIKLQLPDKKRDKLIAKYRRFLKSSCKIQDLAELIGLLTSACPAVSDSQLYTRQLEFEKTQALIRSGFNYNVAVSVSAEAISDIKWWISSLQKASKCIRNSSYSHILTTDANLPGWGATYMNKIAKGN
jgi:hypothetical protein